MRREFLRGYVTSLLSEGVFSDAKTPRAILRKTIEAVSLDVPVVVGELTEKAAAATGRKATSFVLARLNDVIHEIDTRGFSTVMREMHSSFRKGVRRAAK